MGRLALCRVHQGTVRRGQQVAWCRRDGSVEDARVAELYVTEGLRRVPAEEAGPGEVIAIAGIPEITIGETIADPADPRPRDAHARGVDHEGLRDRRRGAPARGAASGG